MTWQVEGSIVCDDCQHERRQHNGYGRCHEPGCKCDGFAVRPEDREVYQWARAQRPIVPLPPINA